MSGVERRAFQRLLLEQPVGGSFSGQGVQILEIGVIGALISNHVPFDRGAQSTLGFEWKDERISLEAAVVRTECHSSPGMPVMMYQTALRFVRAIGNSDRALRDMLTCQVRQLLTEYHCAEERVPIRENFDADETMKIREGFVTYYLSEGEWHRRPTLLPDQPVAGFTVASDEDPSEVSQLRRFYEEADNEGMHLIRLFAELSVCRAAGIPFRNPQ
ncbi:MAG: hypothetical protein WBX15_13750 [Thermoanaerobaculia bacterium]